MVLKFDFNKLPEELGKLAEMDVGKAFSELTRIGKENYKRMRRLNLSDELYVSLNLIWKGITFGRDHSAYIPNLAKKRILITKLKGENEELIEENYLLHKENLDLKEQRNQFLKESEDKSRLVFFIRDEKKKLRDELVDKGKRYNRLKQAGRAVVRRNCLESFLEGRTNTPDMSFVLDYHGNIVSQTEASKAICGNLVGKKYASLIKSKEDYELKDVFECFSSPSLNSKHGWIYLNIKDGPQPALIEVEQKYFSEQIGKHIDIDYPITDKKNGYIRYATIAKIKRYGKTDEIIEDAQKSRYFVQDSLRDMKTSKQIKSELAEIRGTLDKLWNMIPFKKKDKNQD